MPCIKGAAAPYLDAEVLTAACYESDSYWEIETVPGKGRCVQVVLKKCKKGNWEFLLKKAWPYITLLHFLCSTEATVVEFSRAPLPPPGSPSPAPAPPPPPQSPTIPGHTSCAAMSF